MRLHIWLTACLVFSLVSAAPAVPRPLSKSGLQTHKTFSNDHSVSARAHRANSEGNTIMWLNRPGDEGSFTKLTDDKAKKCVGFVLQGLMKANQLVTPSGIDTGDPAKVYDHYKPRLQSEISRPGRTGKEGASIMLQLTDPKTQFLIRINPDRKIEVEKDNGKEVIWTGSLPQEYW